MAVQESADGLVRLELVGPVGDVEEIRSMMEEVGDLVRLVGEADAEDNALLHTRSGRAGGWFGVEMHHPEKGPAYLGVCDLGGAGRPLLDRRPASGTLTVGGFGVAIVRDLVVQLSQIGSPATGHTVWVHLDIDAHNHWANGSRSEMKGVGLLL
ncbi:hypothetical protein AB0C27_09880 [Nonomuraea sp. NPDC048882]|uniref:hypothetical protein n=1 Tax=Nonomuraea sp. NPDC048882 TaxID=3154347 RepID=UPI003405E117